MTDTVQQQAVAGQPVPAGGIPGEGITGFVVRANASKKVAGDLITHSTEIRYEFGRTVQPVDVVQAHDEQSKLATELATRVVEDRVAQAQAAQAQLAATVPAAPAQPVAGNPDPGVPVPPAPAPYVPQAPAPAQPQVQPQAGGIPPFESWPEGQKPNGHGTVKYLPTSVMPTDVFRAKIAEAIRANGDNPDLLAIFDERTGDRGFENGGQNYGVASVKPGDNHPAKADARFTTDKGYAKSVYYVDFQKDGSVTVKPTNDYSTWLEVQRQVQAQMAAQQPAGSPI